MNFKKNWKRFWTLSSAREGFTLVELIVVIAILAILAGVAVPAYSGYVKKANMQADMTLASEVAHALTLYYYAHPEEVTSGYVVLNPEGTRCTYDDAGVGKAAMDAVFGEGWENTVGLKYDGWTGGTSAEVMAILQQQGEDTAAAVAGSTYANNVSQMLNDAQNCTSALAQFLGNFTAGDMEDSFTKLAGNSEGLEAILVQAGLAEVRDDGVNYDLVDPNSTTNTQLSNALILAIAGEVTGEQDVQSSISDAWMSAAISGSWENTGMSVLADTAVRYAYYESIATYINDPTLTTAFENMNGAFESASSEEAVYAAMSGMDSAIAAYMAANQEGSTLLDNYFNTQLATDAQAFAAVMGAVNGVTDSFADSDTLNQDEMYLSDSVSNTVNSYVTAAKNYGVLPANVAPGTILIVLADGNVYSVPAV